MSKILFLFEGKELEPGIFEASVPAVIPDTNLVNRDRSIVCEYGTHIYNLYQRLKKDDGLGIVGLLMEEPDKYPKLKEAVDAMRDTEENFEAIYLVFDYDGHVNMPRNDDGTHIDGDEALREMFEFFDNSSDNGKLFISYPMAEALKHLTEPPESKEKVVTAKCKGPHCTNEDCPHRANREACPPVRKYYKGLVNKLHPEFAQTVNIDRKEWGRLFECHIRVAELLSGSENLVDTQATIFEVQLREYISQPCPQVAVLSAFPCLFIDYLGNEAVRRQVSRLAE